LCYFLFAYSFLRLLDKFSLSLPSDIYIPIWGKELLEKSIIKDCSKRGNIDDLLNISFFLFYFILLFLLLFLS
jgi:hypothetical protein